MSTTNTTTRKIVLAYDNSPNSNHALDVCIKQNIFQKGSSDEVIVITVVNEDVSNLYTPLEIQGAAYAGEWIANDYKDRCDSLESEAKAVLTKVIAKLKEQGYNAEGVILRGKPNEELQSYCTKYNIDLLVVGSRGLGFIKRQLLGSVTDYLAHNLTNTSLLIVKTTEEEKANEEKANDKSA